MEYFEMDESLLSLKGQSGRAERETLLNLRED